MKKENGVYYVLSVTIIGAIVVLSVPILFKLLM